MNYVGYYIDKLYRNIFAPLNNALFFSSCMPILYSKKKHIEYSGFSDDKIFPIRKMSPLQKCIPVESMIKPWYFVVRHVGCNSHAWDPGNSFFQSASPSV